MEADGLKFCCTIWLLNQIWKWVKLFIRGFINPLNLCIFSKVIKFFKVTIISTALRFTQPHFIERKEMMKKRVTRDELVIRITNIAIRVKEMFANIIKQGIIARAKYSFKQVIKDLIILW